MKFKWQIYKIFSLKQRNYNESIYDFTRKCLEFYDIEPSALEFELTERSTIEDESTVFSELTMLRSII